MIIKGMIDAETGGLDPLRHSLLSLCIMPVDDKFDKILGIPAKTFKMYNSNLEVDVQALNVNGLFDYQKYPTYHDAFIEMFKWFSENKITGIEPIGQNFAVFDYPFMRFWLGNEIKIFKRQVRDTKIVAEFLKDCGLYLGGTSLKDLCAAFGVPYQDAHTAEGDCEMTRLVYREMLTRFAEPNTRKVMGW